MVANIAKNHRFPQNLPTSFGNILCQIFAIFELPTASFGKTIHSGLFINSKP